MATIQELDSSGTLNRYEADLSIGVQPERAFYASGSLVEWIAKELPEMLPQWRTNLKPKEQVVGLLGDYVSGLELSIGYNLKSLVPVASGIWEFKTADVRIFGWFPKKDCFIGAYADDVDRIKTFNLYHGYIKQTVEFREKLDLDCPKYIEGDDPYAVVSNYSIPWP